MTSPARTEIAKAINILTITRSILSPENAWTRGRYKREEIRYKRSPEGPIYTSEASEAQLGSVVIVDRERFCSYCLMGGLYAAYVKLHPDAAADFNYKSDGQYFDAQWDPAFKLAVLAVNYSLDPTLFAYEWQGGISRMDDSNVIRWNDSKSRGQSDTLSVVQKAIDNLRIKLAEREGHEIAAITIQEAEAQARKVAEGDKTS